MDSKSSQTDLSKRLYSLKLAIVSDLLFFVSFSVIGRPVAIEIALVHWSLSS